MRSLLVALLLIPALAWAEPFRAEKPTVCDTIDAVMQHLTEKYNEVPVWNGRGAGKFDEGNSIMMLMNHSTKTWTIIQYNDKVACILAVGDDLQFSPAAFGTKI